ncbi:MAG: FAD-dependent oxidoreductase [Chloroflexi bacterium]|nr:FAD-dependent oxidoreductase [Chloroflexota bacterium]
MSIIERLPDEGLDRADVPPPADLLVVGAGVAGLTAALTAADQGARVTILSKGPLDISASFLAQGGVAAVQDPADDPMLHLQDTLEAGRGTCRPSAVEVLVAEAPDRVAELRAMGVPFDADLALEGGHSRRRIAHVAGAETGRAITAALLERVLAHPAIAVMERTHVEHLLPGIGVITDRGELRAPRTILATGGYAALWSRTTNPAGSVGEGIVQAWAVGADLADLELVQFHPTVVAESSMLLSEALRGEGAWLVDEDGARFTDELAPRDVVARAVGARSTALLDLRPVDQDRFRSLMGRLEAAGYHPASEPVPVSPAAHFTVGGIVTDLHGRTTVPGLYAAGECATTGLHGANRLASNSLAECLVFGRRAALAACADPRSEATTTPSTARTVVPASMSDTDLALDAHDREALWRDAGLIRDADGLARLMGARQPLVRLIARSAAARTESRGGHYRSDHPTIDPALDGRHVVIRGEAAPVLETWS